MKNLVIAIAMLVGSVAAQANQQIVEVVWPFSPGSSQAAMLRNIIDNANGQQSQYRFIFESRPGAGGTIAANHTTSSNRLTVLAASNGFYTRPMMYNASHDPDQFRLVNTVCLDIPSAIFSRKYRSLSELKNRDSTIGVIPGGLFQLLPHLLERNHPEFKFTQVNYKGSVEATTDMLGRHIDISVDLPGKETMARLESDTAVLAITGSRNLNGMPTFASQGITGLEHLTVSFYLFVSQTVDQNTARSINKIFNAAIDKRVRENCANELGVVELVSFEQAERLHADNKARWRTMTQGIAKQ